MNEEQNNFQNSPEYKKIRRAVFLGEVKKQLLRSLGFYLSLPVWAFVAGITVKLLVYVFMWAYNLI